MALLYSRNQHNIVNQLYFIEKIKIKQLKKRKTSSPSRWSMIQPTFPLQVLQFYFLHLICLEFILISGVSCFSPVTYYPRTTFCIIPLSHTSLKLHLHCTLCRLGLLCLFSLYWTILIIAGSSYSLIFIRYIVLQPGLLHHWHISVFCVFILDVSLPIPTCWQF